VEEITLESVTERALRMIDRMLADLERRMDEPVAEGLASGLENKTAMQCRSLGNDLTKVTRSLTGMLREARAQKKDAMALFKRTSVAERNAIVLDHVRNHFSRDAKMQLAQQLMDEVQAMS